VVLHGSQHIYHGHLQAHQQRQQLLLLQRKGRKQEAGNITTPAKSLSVLVMRDTDHSLLTRAVGITAFVPPIKHRVAPSS
jgi:hypothetical protein